MKKLFEVKQGLHRFIVRYNDGETVVPVATVQITDWTPTAMARKAASDVARSFEDFAREVRLMEDNNDQR